MKTSEGKLPRGVSFQLPQLSKNSDSVVNATHQQTSSGNHGQRETLK